MRVRRKREGCVMFRLCYAKAEKNDVADGVGVKVRVRVNTEQNMDKFTC